MKLKVGQKIRIRKDLILGTFYGEDSLVEEMTRFLGKIVTIREIYGGESEFSIKEDNGEWGWTPEMIEWGLKYRRPRRNEVKDRTES